MMRRRTLLAAAVTALMAGIGSGSAWAEPSTASAATIRVREREFKLVPSATSVRAGKVIFVARNAGEVAHNLVVLRTKLAPGKLPMVGSRAKEVGLQGKTPVFGAGKTRRLTLTLKRGRYVLICNVPGHYKAGMFAGLRVR